MLRTVSVLVDARDRAEALVRGHEERLEAVAGQSRRRPRPRVYTEEWDEPLITGMRWMSVLVRIACSDDVFPEPARQPAAKYRIVTPEAVLACRPEVILAS
ncbi:iron complex transport system substrate-binding protein [Methylobacterium pseudosasicola]|uniref:Iron complex transport system substrate-binding protein n=1 Tax=Methylobacterium pseudosasicola TaxID=582667 RepID=A0A1I4PUI2_9HYPH|nr:iron complex transport system substrate-binding protein [Methylobacterium pseudosasicola]